MDDFAQFIQRLRVYANTVLNSTSQFIRFLDDNLPNSNQNCTTCYYSRSNHPNTFLNCQECVLNPLKERSLFKNYWKKR